MSTRRRDILDIGAAGARHIAGALTGLVTIPVVAYELGAEALGAWALLGVAFAIVGLSDLGMTVPVQRATVQGDHDKARRMLALALLVNALATPLSALLVYSVMIHGTAVGAVDGTARWALLAVVLAGAASALASPARGLVLARGGIRGLTVARVVAAVLQLLTMFAVLATCGGLVAPALGLLVGAVVEACFVAALTRGVVARSPLRRTSPPPGELRDALRDAMAALTINLATTATTRIDIFVLAQVAPLRVVAAYGVASRVIDQAFVLAKQVGTALLPSLGAASERAAAVRFGTSVLGGLVASGMVALTLTGQAWLEAWAGPVAEDPVFGQVLALLAIAATLMAGQEIAASALTLGGRTAWRSATPIAAGAALNVTLTLAFASAGATFIATATIAGAALTAGLVWRRTSELLRWSWGNILRTLAPTAAAGVAAVGGALVLASAAASSVLMSVLSCAAVTSIGCGAAAAAARGLRR